MVVVRLATKGMPAHFAAVSSVCRNVRTTGEGPSGAMREPAQ